MIYTVLGLVIFSIFTRLQLNDLRKRIRALEAKQ